jgi:hypothetical protein
MCGPALFAPRNVPRPLVAALSAQLRANERRALAGPPSFRPVADRRYDFTAWIGAGGGEVRAPFSVPSILH